MKQRCKKYSARKIMVEKYLGRKI